MLYLTPSNSCSLITANKRFFYLNQLAHLKDGNIECLSAVIFMCLMCNIQIMFLLWWTFCFEDVFDIFKFEDKHFNELEAYIAYWLALKCRTGHFQILVNPGMMDTGSIFKTDRCCVFFKETSWPCGA